MTGKTTAPQAPAVLTDEEMRAAGGGRGDHAKWVDVTSLAQTAHKPGSSG